MYVLTVGSATIDIIATIASKDVEQMRLTNQTASFLLIEPGSKVDADQIQTFIGGGAVNAAIGLARQGCCVSTLAMVGNDINGKRLLEQLHSEGVDTSAVLQSDSQATGVSVLIASHERDAAIFSHRGANCCLQASDIHADLFKDVDLVFISNLSNGSADQFSRLVDLAKSKDAFVSINPGIRQLTRKTDAFFDSLQNVDLLICNVREAQALAPKLVERTGWNSQETARLKHQDLVLDVEGFRLSAGDYFSKLHALGPKYVVITCGAQGAYLGVDGHQFHQPVIETSVLGTTGAGDSFASTLASALVRGEDPKRALELASHNAASVVSHLDAHTGLLSAQALAARVAKATIGICRRKKNDED